METSSVKRIRIAITDDHQILRQGLVAALTPFQELEIVLLAENGQRLLDQYAQVKPDVCLMDINMPEMDGITATRQLTHIYPEARVVALSVFDQDSYVAGMFHAGARGYVLKDAAPEELVHAIKTVYEGEYYFRENLSMALFKRLHEAQHPAIELKPGHDAELTSSEQKVLVLICKERTTAEIAEELRLSTKTVENYRNKILIKVGARNTAGLVTYAIRKGYVIIH